MQTRTWAVTWLLAFAVVAGTPVAQEQAPAAAGHWEGAIQTPGQELAIVVDLAPSAGETWQATIDIPAQNLKAFPLSGVTVTGEKVAFLMPNIPGGPAFAGTVSKDGKQLSGDFTQGGQTFPFALTRTGDAKIQKPPASTPVAPEIEGAWEGALESMGQTLRLVLKLANKPGGGPAHGTLISVDQGGAEIPAAAVVQNAARLEIRFPTIGGTFEGEFKEGILTGTWTQGPGKAPLVLKKRQQP